MIRYRIIDAEGSVSFDIGDSKVVRIGRLADNDLVVPRKLVSGHHAEVLLGPDGPVIRDVGSKNGTFVNGEHIRNSRPLIHGDQIIIGGQALLLEAITELAETSVTVLDGDTETTQVHAAIDVAVLLSAQRNLAILNETGSLLLEAKDEKELTARILDLVFSVLPAERGCVILVTPDGTPTTMAARSREGRTESVAVPRTILFRAIEEGVALLTSDAATDERFKAGHSVVVQGIRGAMCAPVRGKRSVLGAIYVDSRLLTGAFRETDLELLTTLGIQAGITIENQRLLHESLKAERLAAVGGVVAGLAHDIRNILTSLKGGAYMLDTILRKHEDAQLAGAWEIVRSTTDTITELVDDMVTYSKERQPAKVVIGVNDLVARVARRFENRAEDAGATIRTDLPKETGYASLDRNGMDRVLSNLIANALDAVPAESGVVEVTTRDRGDRVEITVRDTGPGVPAESRDHIFDLLYSTKGSRGTGFGLAVTKKIVNEHGGSVELVSEPDSGAAFRILLPRS